MEASKVKEQCDKEDPDKVGYPVLKDFTLGKVAITSGWDGPDYVWHISTIHPKIQFKVREQQLLHEIVSLMNKVVPQSCKVNVFTPLMDWDVKMYTFKAQNLKSYWQITNEVLDELMKKIFIRLNALI